MEFPMAVQRLSPLTLSDDERAELKSLTMRRKTAQALALRARIVLACAEGGQNKEVAAALGLDRATVGKWRRRFVERRVDGLHDEPRSGAPRRIDDARVEAVIVKTLESLPKDATHWSSRGMAKASGLSVSTVQRVWRAFGLQPHRMETFKLSSDPNRGQGARCRRPLCLAAGARHRSLCGREVANPGTGPQPADAADASRPGGSKEP
jgi:transposase